MQFFDRVKDDACCPAFQSDSVSDEHYLDAGVTPVVLSPGWKEEGRANRNPLKTLLTGVFGRASLQDDQGGQPVVGPPTAIHLRITPTDRRIEIDNSI